MRITHDYYTSNFLGAFCARYNREIGAISVSVDGSVVGLGGGFGQWWIDICSKTLAWSSMTMGKSWLPQVMWDCRGLCLLPNASCRASDAALYFSVSFDQVFRGNLPHYLSVTDDARNLPVIAAQGSLFTRLTHVLSSARHWHVSSPTWTIFGIIPNCISGSNDECITWLRKQGSS